MLHQRNSMLVVTRKKDEKLIIGNEIEIQVLRIGRDNVRLGIKAPAHISIYRYEIYEAIKNENVTAVTSQIPDKETVERLAKRVKAEWNVISARETIGKASTNTAS